jgi:hypothetical protein
MKLLFCIHFRSSPYMIWMSFSRRTFARGILDGRYICLDDIHIWANVIWANVFRVNVLRVNVVQAYVVWVNVREEGLMSIVSAIFWFQKCRYFIRVSIDYFDT